MLILLEVIAVIARLDILEATVRRVSSYISLFFLVSKRTEFSKSLEGERGGGVGVGIAPPSQRFFCNFEKIPFPYEDYYAFLLDISLKIWFVASYVVISITN